MSKNLLIIILILIWSVTIGVLIGIAPIGFCGGILLSFGLGALGSAEILHIVNLINKYG